MRRFNPLVLLVLCAPVVVPADQTPRSPEQLTAEERGRMVEGANAYGTCLATEAGQFKEEPDPRTIADKAMGACRVKLDELDAVMEALALDPAFAEGFRNSTRDRAARRLLGLLMEIKGQ
jgi:hypothetical protein